MFPLSVAAARHRCEHHVVRWHAAGVVVSVACDSAADRMFVEWPPLEDSSVGTILIAAAREWVRKSGEVARQVLRERLLYFYP